MIGQMLAEALPRPGQDGPSARVAVDPDVDGIAEDDVDRRAEPGQRVPARACRAGTEDRHGTTTAPDGAAR